MDALTFIASLVQSLAWPCVVLGVLLLVRKELPDILRSLRKLKFKDVELEFGEAARALAEETRRAVPPATGEAVLLGQTQDSIANRLDAIAEISPRAAILEAWLHVEATAANFIRLKTAAPSSSTPGPLRLLEGLRRAGILTPPQEAAFEQLRHLRNEAVHAPEAEFTPMAVSNYIQSALAMANYLEDMAR